MSNQFYNYLANHIFKFFEQTKIKSGDRFYLQLDSKNELNSLLTAIKEVMDTKPFVYQHDLGDEYRTVSVSVNNINLVISNTEEAVKPDFLVTLRNQVGEQKGVWKNTALLSIVTEQLDSIQGGSSDLQKEGMPLHPNFLYKKLKTDIENRVDNKIEQVILLDNLTSLISDQMFQQISFFDFENIFAVITKGKLEEQDYINFGLFKDLNLGTISGNKLKERLSINRELFDYVKKVHDFGLGEDELDKRFTQDGVGKLKGENWHEQPFNEIHKSYEDKKKQDKSKFELLEWKVRDGLKAWDKATSDTTAGKRKRNIVIFNPNHLDLVELNLSFGISGSLQRSLSPTFIKVPSKQNLDYELGRTNLKLKISCNKNKSTFTRISYKHENKASLGVELNIAVLPVEPLLFDSYKTAYLVDAKKHALELQYEGDSLVFGDGITLIEQEITTNEQNIIFTEDNKLKITPQLEALSEEEQVTINLYHNNNHVPIVLKNELPESTPITGIRIWKLKREKSLDFEWNNNKLIQGNQEYYLHAEYKQFFEWEREWVRNGFSSATVDSGELLSVSLTLPEDLRESYSRFVNSFRTKNSIPSLCHYNPELTHRAKEYVSEYIRQIQLFDEGTEAGEKGRDIFKLGTITTLGEVYFTPFHPIMVSFQLKVNELIASEELESSILNRLKPEALVPYIYQGKENLFKPDSQNAAPEWMIFKPVNQVSIADANQYLAKVIEDKTSQFMEHFSYLFIENSKAPLKLNIINISNDREVLRGILQWMISKIKKQGPEHLVPVEINIYQQQKVNSSTFDQFSRMESIVDIQQTYDIKLKTNEYDEQDVIRFIRDKLFYYKHSLDNEIKYAHISFYKMEAQENYALQPMEEMVSGFAVQGLYSSVPSMKGKENYRSGFGIKAYGNNHDNLLIDTAYYVNELAANLRNDGSDSYHKGEAIFSRTTTADEDTLDKIFKSSFWVTFVDPTADLEFFNNYGKNLVVIHYSDQYSSSSRYDAITVTDKSNQYHAVIKEFIQSKEVKIDEDSVNEIILAFNTFNGEWLLRIIGSKGHYSREKLSIISAIKYSLSYFDHPNITWVPISLEEILRVAGAVSLNKTDGLFTAKNLGVKGKHSDDLLLIGLEQNAGLLKLHFLPIEVKIGINSNSTIEKAKEQLRNTKRLIHNALTSENKNFSSMFYRNFFVQLFISNAKKIAQSKLWNGKNYHLTEGVLEKLLKDQYVISNELEKHIGSGAILSFQKDIYVRGASLEEEATLISLTEHDGYSALIKPINELCEWVQKGKSDFIKEGLLSYNYISTVMEDEPSIDHDSESDQKTATSREHYHEANDNIDNSQEENQSNSFNEQQKLTEQQEQEEHQEQEEQQEREEPEGLVFPTFKLEDSRILIGKASNSNKEIYWEYGNKGLANRHLLISGKSGQGKTYFMQCLLLEKSKQGIPSIVIDYTEGFLPNQLEQEFVEHLGEKFKQTVVYIEKFPINPFKKNVREISGLILPESETDVAERIKSVFAAVYKTLGIQQLNAIYEATLRGLSKHGEAMDLTKLKEVLEEDGSNYARTALSQIRPLIDRNPFSNKDAINWKEVVDSNGEVYIIQLTGYPRDVQLMITEFILWDLWNYSVRHGNKNKPMPVVMDEAQNLDHTEKSPSARILTEGRKFGWSAWYATQFLKSQLDAGELARLQNASQQIYFAPPEQEISTIASTLAQDASEKKQWEAKLSGLKKGQCIVYGPILLENGELSKPTALIVDITSLDKRI